MTSSVTEDAPTSTQGPPSRPRSKDKSKAKSKASRAGLAYPVSRVQHLLRKRCKAQRIGCGSSIYFSAVAEEVMKALFQRAFANAQKCSRKRIQGVDLMQALSGDARDSFLRCLFFDTRIVIRASSQLRSSAASEEPNKPTAESCVIGEKSEGEERGRGAHRANVAKDASCAATVRTPDTRVDFDGTRAAQFVAFVTRATQVVNAAREALIAVSEELLFAARVARVRGVQERTIA